MSIPYHLHRKIMMETETIFYLEDHPWVELVGKDKTGRDKTAQEIGLSEEILYSLDEIRLG